MQSIEKEKAENKLRITQKALESAQTPCKRIFMDFMASEEVVDNTITENQELHEIIASMRCELESAEENSTTQSEKTNFSFETKKGKFYSDTIRKLYYNLLANQVPATKIASIVESVIQCFLPNIDMSTLQLPKES